MRVIYQIDELGELINLTPRTGRMVTPIAQNQQKTRDLQPQNSQKWLNHLTRTIYQIEEHPMLFKLI